MPSPHSDVARRAFEIGISLQEHLLNVNRVGAEFDAALLELRESGRSVETAASEAHLDVALVQHVFDGHHSLDYLLGRMISSALDATALRSPSAWEDRVTIPDDFDEFTAQDDRDWYPHL